MVAVGIFAFLGVCALAIDLAVLYVTRNEAQRAADAAALAGAKAFVDSGFVAGVATQSAGQTAATHAAVAVGNQSLVGGQNPAIGTNFSTSCPPAADSDGCFDFSITGNPRITVVVQRTAARKNAMPTFFAKVFGVRSADIVAEATAEAYNPGSSSTGPTLCVACLKPFLVPNCDPNPNPNYSRPPESVCPQIIDNNNNKTAQAYFVDPNTGLPTNPGKFSTGAIGEPWTLRSIAGSTSQWYQLQLGCSSGDDNSGRGFTACTTGCATAKFACGASLTTLNGDNENEDDDEGGGGGPTDRAIDTLIHAKADGLGNGQDTITINSDGTWTITGGSNNPNPALVGKTVTNSDSLVTVPIFNGDPSQIQREGGSTVKIVGFMQMFIQSVKRNGTSVDITAVILSVTGCGSRTGTCGTSGGGSGGGTVGSGGSFIPIRLVRNPGT
jgi:hypothetical protein